MSELYPTRPPGERIAALETALETLSLGKASKGDVKALVVAMEHMTNAQVELKKTVEEGMKELRGLARQEAQAAYDLAQSEIIKERNIYDGKLKSHKAEVAEDIDGIYASQATKFEWFRILIPASIPVIIFIIAMLMGQSGGDAGSTSMTYQPF